MARRRVGLEMYRDAGGVIWCPRQDGVVYLRAMLHAEGLDCSSRTLSRYLENGTIPLTYHPDKCHHFFVTNSGFAAVIQYRAAVPVAAEARGYTRSATGVRGRNGRFIPAEPFVARVDPELFRIPPPLSGPFVVTITKP